MSSDRGFLTAATPRAERRNAEMERWRRRSRRIAFYRRALPWLMLAIVTAVIGWVAYRAIISARRDAEATSTVIRMTNPQFFGRDDEGRSFRLTAREAVRASGDVNLVTLVEPGMQLDIDGETPTSIAGGRGFYREDTKVLRLDGGVRLQDGRGVDLASDEAVVDTLAGVVTGENGVTGRAPLGQVSASSYAIYEGGARAVFRGGVRSRIDQQ